MSLIDPTNHRLRRDVARACRAEATYLRARTAELLRSEFPSAEKIAAADEERARELQALADLLDGGR